MPKLILSCKKDLPERVDAGSTEASASTASSSTALHLHLLRRCLQLLALRGVEVTTEDVINQVDQFLHKALQNPRERLSISYLQRYCASGALENLERKMCSDVQLN